MHVQARDNDITQGVTILYKNIGLILSLQVPARG